MKDDISNLEPLLEDGDYSNLIPIQRSSYTEKLWGILPHHSAASWLNLRNYGMTCPSYKTAKDKSTMTDATGSPVSKRIRSLLPVILLALLVIVLCLYLWCPWSHLAQVEIEIDRPGDGENTTEAVLVRPEELSLSSLLQAQGEVPPWAAMRNCLDKAAQEFSKEPVVLKTNARMVLQCNGTRQEFLSGEGENVIEVVWIDGTVKYLVHEASPEVRVARLSRHPLPLNLTALERVWQDLVTQGASAELLGCLDKAIQEFPLEPMAVQNNAKLVVSCGTELTFISGEGQTEINVYKAKTDKGIQYSVKATGWAWWSRFFKRGAV